MSVWLNVIGVTEAGVAALPPHTRGLLEKAATVIGVKRRLSGPGGDRQTLVEWDGKLDEMLARIVSFRGQPTVLLASGDPNWFGIGATLARQLKPEEFAVHPAPSSFQLAAAKLHWPLQNVATISLHGRSVDVLQPHILPGNRILALTSDRTTLSEVAGMLMNRNYAASQLTTLENLGSADERITHFKAPDAAGHGIGDFYVLAVDCAAASDAALLPPVPGLPDEVFVSDGQLTKRDVRAATLAKLAPFPGALLWDVGAGCGSVGIEWMRAARDSRAIAFERNEARVQMIETNRQALGVPGLEIRAGSAPDTIAGADRPDAIFLGGDVRNAALFEACWTALKPSGRLVANAVTLDGEQALIERQAEWGGDLTRLNVSVLDRIGEERVFRPRMTVTQWFVRRQGK